MFLTYTNQKTGKQVLAVPVSTGNIQKVQDAEESTFRYSEFPYSTEVKTKKLGKGDYIVKTGDTLKVEHYSSFLTYHIPTATRIG